MHMDSDSNLISTYGNGKTYTCTFCSGKYSAMGYWHCKTDDTQVIPVSVFCCVNCAKNILPRLMADSLYAHVLSDGGYTNDFIDKVTDVFYAALTNRLQHTVRRLRK